MKKKIILFFFIVFFVFLKKPVVHFVFEKVLHSKFQYEAFEFKKRSFVFHHCNLSKYGKIEKMRIKPFFHRFSLHFNIYLKKPELELKGPLLSSKKPKKRFHFHIQEGLLKTKQGSYIFSLFQKKNRTCGLIREKDFLSSTFSFEKRGSLASVRFENFNPAVFVNFFPKCTFFQEGRATGNAKISLDRQEAEAVIDWDLVDLKDSKWVFQAKKFHIEGIFPLNNRFENLQVRSSVQEGKIEYFQLRLEEISGDFFYSPCLGPKFSINGKLNEEPFTFLGKGYLQSSFSDWMDLILTFENGSRINVLSKESENQWLFNVDFENFKENQISSLSKILKSLKILSFQIEKGTFHGSFDLHLQNKKVHSINFKSFKAENPLIFLPNEKIHLSLGKCEGSIFWKSGKISSDLQIEDGIIYQNKSSFFDFYGNFSVNKNHFDQSAFCFKGMHLEGTVKPSGTLASYRLDIESTGDFNALLEKKIHLGKEAKACFSVEKKEGRFAAFGKFQDINDLFFHFDLEKNFFTHFLEKSFHKMSFSGWIKAQKMDLGKADFFISNKKFSLSGVGDIDCFFQKNKIIIYLKGKNLGYHSSVIDIAFDSIGESGAFLYDEKKECVCTVENNEFTLSLPVFSGKCFIFNQNISLFNADLKIQNGVIESHIQKIEKNEMRASADLNFHIKKQVIHANVYDFSGMLKDLPLEFFKNAEGFLKGDFCFSYAFLDKIWNSKGHLALKEGGYPIGKKAKVQKLDLDFCWDENSFDVKDLQGFLHDEKKVYCLSAPVLKKENDIEFDLRLGEKTWDPIRLAGRIIKDERWKVIFEKEPVLFGMGCNVSEMTFSQNGHLLSLNASVESEGKKISSFFHFLEDLSIFPSLNLPLDGILKGEFFYNEKTFYFDLFSEKLIYGNYFGPFSLSGKAFNNHLYLEKIRFLDIDANAVIEKTEDGLQILNLYSKNKGHLLKGEGVYKNDRFQLNLHEFIVPLESFFTGFKGKIEGKGCFSIEKTKGVLFDADIQKLDFSYKDCYFENKEPLHFSYKDQNAYFYGLNFSVAQNGTFTSFSSKEGIYSCLTDQFLFFHSNLNVPMEFIKKAKMPLKELNLSFKKIFFDRRNVQLKASFGNFHLFNANIMNLTVQLNRKLGFCHFDLLLNGLNLKIENQFSLENGCKAQTKFFDSVSDRPLTIDWEYSDGFDVSSVKGSFQGIDADFFKTPSKKNLFSLLGSMKIDGEKISLLCNEKCKCFMKKIHLKKGFAFKGELTSDKKDLFGFSLKGILLGKQLEMFRYRFKMFHGDLDLNCRQLHIRNVKIADSGGAVSIPSIFYDIKQDHLDIPIIEGKEIRPSLFEKEDGSTEPIKPFLIRYVEISDIKGSLRDLSSITGSGYCQFINSFKRKNTVFDIPSDMLGRIVGLDLDLLIPVCGRFDFTIENEKILLNSLKESYSENKRSKFFLVDELNPYIDFEGNVQMYIKMKQYVLFKLTENLLISVKGKIHEPNFTLRKKRGLKLP